MNQITDHAERAVARLPTQYRESPRIRGMLVALSQEVQFIEDAFWAVLLAYRTIAVATGVTLDSIGRLLAAPVRGSKTDVQYRQRLNAQIFANKSSGDFANVYAMAKAMVAGWAVSGQPKVTEFTISTYEIGADSAAVVVNDNTEALELAIMLNKASSAGVRAIVRSRDTSIGAGAAFRFAGGGGASKGFGVGKFAAAYDK